MWFLGLVFLVIGLFTVRRELAAAPGIDKLIGLGRVFAASSLALFAGEHLAGASFIKGGVPPWMPGRLFWAYLVGLALLATAVSLALKRYDGLSSLMMAVMLFLFVLMLHLPRVAANPRDRISWVVALRDSAFAGGFLAFAGAQRGRGGHWMVMVGRIIFGVAALFFAVEHFLHPASAPGVPLEKVIPAWFPLPPLWGYLTGVVLLAAGVALLLNKRARVGAAWVGLAAALLTFLLYTPILIASILHGGQGSELIEDLNYVGDTLLFAGTALLLAAALRGQAPPMSKVE
jgi:uncharacterized membrane protein